MSLAVATTSTGIPQPTTCHTSAIFLITTQLIGEIIFELSIITEASFLPDLT
jgi:hypothetical protein